MKPAVCFKNCAECQSARIDGSCSERFFYTPEEAIAAIKENCNIAFIDADIAGEMIEQYCQNVLGITVSAIPVKIKLDDVFVNSHTFFISPAGGYSFMIKLPKVQTGDLIQGLVQH